MPSSLAWAFREFCAASGSAAVRNHRLAVALAVVLAMGHQLALAVAWESGLVGAAHLRSARSCQSFVVQAFASEPCPPRW